MSLLGRAISRLLLMQHDDDEQRGSEELKYERRTALRRPAKEGGR